MLNITLVRLAPDARSADIALGQADAVTLSLEQFGQCLEAFCTIDSLQNAHADPEIRVQAGQQKYIVRTGQGRLFLYNARDSTQPAQVLTVGEVLAELDGSAQAVRTAAPFPDLLMANPPDEAPIPESPPPRRPWLPVIWAGSFVVAVIAAWVGYVEWEQRIDALPADEASSFAEGVEGVYVSGTTAKRGIALSREGGARFFEDQGAEPPAITLDSWRAKRRDGVVRLELSSAQSAIEVVDRDTVRFGDTTYRRAQSP